MKSARIMVAAGHILLYVVNPWNASIEHSCTDPWRWELH